MSLIQLKLIGYAKKPGHVTQSAEHSQRLSNDKHIQRIRGNIILSSKQVENLTMQYYWGKWKETNIRKPKSNHEDKSIEIIQYKEMRKENY